MFEYKYIQNVREKKLEETLNEWGSAGWRLMQAEVRKISNGDSSDMWGLLFERVAA